MRRHEKSKETENVIGDISSNAVHISTGKMRLLHYAYNQMSIFFRYVWYLFFFFPFIRRCCRLVLRSFLRCVGVCACAAVCTCVCVCISVRFTFDHVNVCMCLRERGASGYMQHIKINEVTTTYVGSKGIAMVEYVYLKVQKFYR